MRCVWDWVLDRGDVIECGVMYGIECGRGEGEERDLEGSMGLSVGVWEDAYVKVLLWITHNKNLSIS